MSRTTGTCPFNILLKSSALKEHMPGQATQETPFNILLKSSFIANHAKMAIIVTYNEFQYSTEIFKLKQRWVRFG